MKPLRKKRMRLMLGVLLIQSIYLPTSLLMEGGIAPKLPIDIFPLWTVWVIPYVLCYPLWIGALVWLVWKASDDQFHTAIAALFFTCALGVSVYLLFPTYVVPPELHGTDLLSNLLRALQATGDHDALPSAHVYITVVLALLYRDWYPQYGKLWAAIVFIVTLSTLFTQQHYTADVLAGALTGWLGYRFGLRRSITDHRAQGMAHV
ncbi:MAG: phosphatase PAP2 family protein [Chloroflexota bacterium]|nr:phosphatase PAP2 family protein [Chloroflexota bacterium]MBI5703788.1 phosphatase PAP2 family protein [Chloroflexota bacterium]